MKTNTMPGKAFSCLHICIVVGLSVAASRSSGFDRIAHGAVGEAQIRNPCDRTSAGESLPMTGGAKQSKRPNVLLIGVDTLRADHVGCLGYERDTTPTLDRLAREGVLCARTMSTSGWTLPSVMSVMTSLYPDVHQTYTYEKRLPEEVTTLAEILRANGYTTAGFISNFIIDGKYGFSDGFDLYDDFTVPLDSGMDIFERHDEVLGERHLVCTSELVTRVAVRWLEHGPHEPFFMFVFYVDPHYDYIPPAPFDTMFDPRYEGDMDGRGIAKEPRHSQRPSDRDLQHLLALYDGEIRYTDGCVAELLQAFAKSGSLNNTLIVFFADHGDEFYEHGKTAHDRTLYDEILHVPLILWWPDRFPAGRRMDALTSLVDIMPTVLDYLGLPHEDPVQGASLRPLIEGKTDRLHDTVWAELNTWIHVQAVIGDRHKLVWNVGDDTWELYHLHHDPGEQANLYAQSSATDIRLAMTAEWEQWTRNNRVLADDLAGGTETPEVQISEQQLLRLKALGYVH